MVLLAVGDVCGEPGLCLFEAKIKALRRQYEVSVCVVNGENTDITGILPDHAQRLYDAGADVVTLGNHTYHRMQIARLLDDSPFLLRPMNFAGNAPGHGSLIHILPDGKRLCVVNLIGRCECDWNADSPFTTLSALLGRAEADLYVVDFHAEATSEKAALAWHNDGLVSAVFGTHTHVQTSDERVLPRGTGFITDLGMTGAVDSILGVRPEQSVSMFLGMPPTRFESPPGPAKLEGALFDIDEQTGRCRAVRRLRVAE